MLPMVVCASKLTLFALCPSVQTIQQCCVIHSTLNLSFFDVYELALFDQIRETQKEMSSCQISSFLPLQDGQCQFQTS